MDRLVCCASGFARRGFFFGDVDVEFLQRGLGGTPKKKGGLGWVAIHRSTYETVKSMDQNVVVVLLVGSPLASR